LNKTFLLSRIKIFQGACTMNYTAKIIQLTLLVSTAACVASATTPVRPFLSFRSQGQDLARQKAGTRDYENKSDMDKHYNLFTVTPEYTRSFNGDDMAKDLFGCWYLQSCNTLKIVGESAASFDTKSLNAGWFGLASNYVGAISFEPVIQNFNTDLSLYWGMDEWVQGVFLRIHTPLTWTKWDLGAKFTTSDTGTVAPIPNGHTTTYLDNAEKFFCKKEAEATDAYTPTALFCSRFCGCSCDDNKTKTRLADIQMDLGWNFLLDQDYNLGLFARVVIPTGNKVKGEWLFEPIVGNGHHWELGGGVTGSCVCWRNKDESKHLNFSVDAELTHLFNAHQNRVFDLKDKPLSRYIQAYKATTNTWSPVANLTSCAMKVNVAVQADVTAMFNYTCHNWSYDLGYNFWARSCEKFECTSCKECDCTNDCNNCTTCCGQCIIKKDVEEWHINTGDTINAYLTGNDIKLTDSMVEYDGSRTKGISNKVFANINYAWLDCEVIPFIGLGGFAEFGSSTDCCNTTAATTPAQVRSCGDKCTSCDDCSGCKNVALSQWGLWLKGGVSF
jgi:hypothetical protein